MPHVATSTDYFWHVGYPNEMSHAPASLMTLIMKDGKSYQVCCMGMFKPMGKRMNYYSIMLFCIMHYNYVPFCMNFSTRLDII